jgi:hypothetical protein
MPIAHTISDVLVQTQSRKAPDGPGLIIFRTVASGPGNFTSRHRQNWITNLLRSGSFPSRR